MSSPERGRVMSLRLRLILVLCGSLGVLLVALFLWLNHTLDNEIRNRLDRNLLDRAHVVAALLGAPRTELGSAELLPEYAQLSHSDFFTVWNRQGHVLALSESSHGRPIALPQREPAAQPFHYDATMPDGHPGRAVALRTRITVGGRPRDAVIAVGQDRSTTEDMVHRVRRVLLAGSALTLALTALLAILAVRAGLGPIERIARRAAALSPEQATPPRFGEQVPGELRPFTRALEDAFARLHGALARERRFARDVAHELRTPLAEMRTTVELAQRDPALAAHPVLATARDALERMQRTVDGLLMLVRLEAGQMELLPEPIELVGLLREQCGGVRAQLDARRLGLALDLPGEAWTQSDGTFLERIVSNLLRNAANYAPEGSVIDVRLHRARGGCVLSIANAAPDLGPEDLPHLGERFWRKRPDLEPAQHGGLGLALAHTLARALQLPLEFTLADGRLAATLGPLPDLGPAQDPRGA